MYFKFAAKELALGALILSTCVSADLGKFKNENDVKGNLPSAIEGTLKTEFAKVETEKTNYGKEFTTVQGTRKTALEKFTKDTVDAFVKPLKECETKLGEADKEHSSSLNSSKVASLSEDDIKAAQTKVADRLNEAENLLKAQKVFYASGNGDYKAHVTTLKTEVTNNVVGKLDTARDAIKTAGTDAKKVIHTEVDKAKNALDTAANDYKAANAALKQADKDAIDKYVAEQKKEHDKLEASYNKKCDELTKAAEDLHKKNTKEVGFDELDKKLTAVETKHFHLSKKEETLEQIISEVEFFKCDTGNVALLHRPATADSLKNEEPTNKLRDLLSKITDEFVLGSGASGDKAGTEGTPAPTTTTEEKSKGISTTLIVVAAILVVLVVAAIVYFAFASSGSK